MQSIDCPRHGDLILRLAQGREGLGRAEYAESVRASCYHCSAWWKSELEGEHYSEIDASVEQAIQGFTPPRRNKRVGDGFLLAAASLVLAAGVVFLSLDRGVRSGAEDAAHASAAGSAIPASDRVEDSDLILSEGFEKVTGVPELAFSISSDFDGRSLSKASIEVEEEQPADVVLSSDFELGGLQKWSDHS